MDINIKELKGQKLYLPGVLFDKLGSGVIRGIKEDFELEVVEIVFEDTLNFPVRQLIPVEEFKRKLDKGEFEIGGQNRWREIERELMIGDFSQALLRISNFSHEDCLILVDLLKERIASEGRLFQERATELLKEVALKKLNSDERQEVLSFLSNLLIKIRKGPRTSRGKRRRQVTVASLTRVMAIIAREKGGSGT